MRCTPGGRLRSKSARTDPRGRKTALRTPCWPAADVGDLERFEKNKHLASFACGHEKLVALVTEVVYQPPEVMGMGGMADVDRDSHSQTHDSHQRRPVNTPRTDATMGRDLPRRQQLTGIMTRESATFAWILRVHRRNEAGKTRLDGVSLCDVISPSETGSNPCPGRPAPRLIQTLLDNAAQSFETDHSDGGASDREDVLLKKIGELTVERDFLSNGLGRSR